MAICYLSFQKESNQIEFYCVFLCFCFVPCAIVLCACEWLGRCLHWQRRQCTATNVKFNCNLIHDTCVALLYGFIHHRTASIRFHFESKQSHAVHTLAFCGNISDLNPYVQSARHSGGGSSSIFLSNLLVVVIVAFPYRGRRRPHNAGVRRSFVLCAWTQC